MLIVGWFNILGNTLAGCQAGYQELHIGGLYLGLGNLFCATGMVILAQQSETTEKSFWLVLYGVPLLLVGCSVFHFLLRHKELRWKPFKFKFEVFRSLFLGGGGFMIVQTIGPFLQGEGTRLYLAHKSDVFQVALMSVFIQVSTIVMGFVVLFVNPLYGAVADALARGDRQWILSKIKKVRLMGLLVVSVLIIIMFFGGPKTFDIWLGSQMVVSRINCLILACYIGAIILVYINQVFLMAMGFLRLSVLVAVLEIICLVVFLFFVKPQTAGLMIAGMALIKFLSSLPLTIIALKSKV
jgi:O-antigen/teichoic acid export membrane protein